MVQLRAQTRYCARGALRICTPGQLCTKLWPSHFRDAVEALQTLQEAAPHSNVGQHSPKHIPVHCVKRFLKNYKAAIQFLPP